MGTQKKISSGFFIGDDNKISIIITEKTFHILRSDSAAFNLKCSDNKNRITATFINKVISGYDIDPSCIERVDRKDNDMHESFAFKPDSKAKDRLDNDIPQAVVEKIGTSGKYVSALLEKYASLDFVERERIFFSDMVRKIMEAKATGKGIRFNSKGKQEMIIPYDVLRDEWSTHNYLIGIRADNGSIASYRIQFISDLKSYTVRDRDPGVLPNEEKQIWEKIRKCGIMYLFATPKEIKVRLTPKGKQLYDNITVRRPEITNVSEDNENIYTFFCTEKQAEDYFRRLSIEAEIISPQTLRNKMFREAKKLCEIYNSNT